MHEFGADEFVKQHVQMAVATVVSAVGEVLSALAEILPAPGHQEGETSLSEASHVPIQG